MKEVITFLSFYRTYQTLCPPAPTSSCRKTGLSGVEGSLTKEVLCCDICGEKKCGGREEDVNGGKKFVVDMFIKLVDS